MTSPQTAILKTLAYAHLFRWPLTLKELHRFLITPQKIPLSRLSSALRRLLATRRVGEKNGFYFLPPNVAFVTSRLKNQKTSAQKLAFLQKNLFFFRLFPTVFLVAVTGNVAVGNAQSQDDIDLLIVTAPHTLWLTRLFLVPLLDFFRLRRRPSDSVFANRLCLNLFLDAGHLSLPSFQHHLFTASELAHLHPLLNRHATYQRLLSHNSWLKKHLANFPLPSSFNSFPSFPFVLLAPLNLLAYLLQLLYIFLHRRPLQKLSLFYAFFHPHDQAPLVLCRYRRLLKKLQLN